MVCHLRAAPKHSASLLRAGRNHQADKGLHVSQQLYQPGDLGHPPACQHGTAWHGLVCPCCAGVPRLSWGTPGSGMVLFHHVLREHTEPSGAQLLPRAQAVRDLMAEQEALHAVGQRPSHSWAARYESPHCRGGSGTTRVLSGSTCGASGAGAVGNSTRVLMGGSLPLPTAETGPGEGWDLLHKADGSLSPPSSMLISEVLSPEYYSLL